MIALAALALGLGFLSVPGLIERPPGCSAARWTRACRTTLVAGLGLVLGGLAFWGAPPIVHLLDGSGLPGFCDSAVHRLPLGGLTWATVFLLVGALAGLRLAFGLTAAVRGARGARIDTLVGEHRASGRYEVVVVPSTRLVAHSVPGRTPQIVLSDGLVELLDEAEIAAVVRHEVAHDRLSHRRYAVLAASIDHLLGWIPSVRRSTTALRGNLEAWADQASAGSPDRVRALTSALERLGEADRTTPVRRATGHRIAALLDERPVVGRFRGAALNAVVTIGLVIAGGFALGALVEFWSALGHCAA